MKYLRLRDEVRELVDDMEPGQPLPPERVLARRLHVSRMTLRKALDELVRSGRVVRRRGAGTFVGPARLSRGLPVTSFSDDIRARGMEPGSRTLETAVVPAGALGRRLEVPAADPVLRVRRLRLADHTPMAVEVLHVPTALVPGLAGEDLAGRSLDALLRERYGLVVASGEQVLEAAVTDADESDALGVPVHSPALLVEQTSRERGGRVVEFVCSVYRGDRYRIVASAGPAAARPASARGA